MKLILLTIACLLAGFPAIGFKKKEVNNGLSSLANLLFMTGIFLSVILIAPCFFTGEIASICYSISYRINEIINFRGENEYNKRYCRRH